MSGQEYINQWIYELLEIIYNKITKVDHIDDVRTKMYQFKRKSATDFDKLSQ